MIVTEDRLNITPLEEAKMIEKTITSIENKVSDAKSIDEKDRIELLKPFSRPLSLPSMN